VEQFLTL